MTKCANCNNEAAYTHAEPGISPVDYCATCLPEWLGQRAAAGHFPLVSSTPDAKTKKETPASEEEPAKSEE